MKESTRETRQIFPSHTETKVQLLNHESSDDETWCQSGRKYWQDGAPSSTCRHPANAFNLLNSTAAADRTKHRAGTRDDGGGREETEIASGCWQPGEIST